LLGLTYDEKRPGQLQLRTSGFMWFYFSVNIGALVSQFGLPVVRDWVTESTGNETRGYQVAFLLPAILMVLALIAFAAGKKHYAKEVIGQRPHLTPEEKKQRFKVLTTLFGVFALMVFFWMAYEQNDNLWVVFAKENIAVDAEKKVCPLHFGPWTWERSPDGFQFFNALCVITFIPLFTWIYAWFDRKGMPLRAMHKMLMGFFMTAMTWVVMSFAAYSASDGGKVSAWWLVVAYIVLTIGEVMVYGTGLELAFSAAPASMKSFVTACFLLTNTGGNLLNAQFLKLYDKSIVISPEDSWFKTMIKRAFHGVGIEHVTPTVFFLITLGIMLLATLAFVFIGRKFERSHNAA
jgi:POT family proton-dependent oligopeptide transporter